MYSIVTGRAWLGAIAVACATALFAGAGSTARAAFAGANGKLAFVRGGDIWVVDADGTNAAQLTTDPAFDRSPRWSPDGAQIAFASNRDGDFDIYVMNADGTSVRQVTFNDAAHDRIPSWTADGSQIVYDKNFAEVYAVAVDGAGPEKKLADGVVPGTSSHGEEVVFGNHGLIRMRLDGAARRSVTHDGSDFGANWSPHGNDLVFTRTDLERDVYAVHANGTGLRRLTNTPDRFEFAPVWSPDGASVAFVGCPGPSATPDCAIFVLAPDRDAEVKLVDGVLGGEGSVDWQPVLHGPPGDLVVGVGAATFPPA